MQAIPRRSLDPRFPRKPAKIPRKVLNLGREIARTEQEVPHALDPGIPIRSEKMSRKVVGPVNPRKGLCLGVPRKVIHSGIPTKPRETPIKDLDQLIPGKC